MHADSGTGEDARAAPGRFFLPDDTGPYSVDICCQRHLLADHGTGALDSAGPSPSGRCEVASGKQRCSHTKPDHVQTRCLSHHDRALHSDDAALQSGRAWFLPALLFRLGKNFSSPALPLAGAGLPSVLYLAGSGATFRRGHDSYVQLEKQGDRKIPAAFFL